MIKTSEVQQYLKESRCLERDYLSELLTSRTRAWRIAVASSGLTLLSLLALVGLTPLKTATPFVLRVDNATGHVDVVTVLQDFKTSYGEVVDSYFLNLYILNRENYDYETLQTLYQTTALLSSPEIQREYLTLFQGSQARDKVLGTNVKVLAHVRSITADPAHGTAVVRFMTQRRQSNGLLDTPLYWIATVGYQYVNAKISLQDRRINPLGFQVTSYRLDPETVSTRGESS